MLDIKLISFIACNQNYLVKFNFVFLVVPNQLPQDKIDSNIAQQTVTAQRMTSLTGSSGNPTPPTVAVVGNSTSSTTTPSGNSKDKVMLPSGASLAIMPPAGASSSQLSSVVPAHVAAGIGVGFPMPHPGDGSMDFSKTEMVTPETSLNMSMAAFLARYASL